MPLLLLSTALTGGSPAGASLLPQQATPLSCHGLFLESKTKFDNGRFHSPSSAGLQKFINDLRRYYFHGIESFPEWQEFSANAWADPRDRLVYLARRIWALDPSWAGSLWGRSGDIFSDESLQRVVSQGELMGFGWPIVQRNLLVLYTRVIRAALESPLELRLRRDLDVEAQDGRWLESGWRWSLDGQLRKRPWLYLEDRSVSSVMFDAFNSIPDTSRRLIYARHVMLLPVPIIGRLFGQAPEAVERALQRAEQELDAASSEGGRAGPGGGNRRRR